MKVTETSSEGRLTYTIPFGRGKGKIANSFTPETDEPICVYYVESGWAYGYPTFHVITEYGDYEETDYKFMSAEQLAEYIGVPVEEVLQPTSTLVPFKEIKEKPNDQDLGEHVRRSMTPF